MKVYVVTSGCYSEYEIEAVFLDLNKAEIYCASHNATSGYDYRIEEFDSDEVQIESKEVPKRTWVFVERGKSISNFGNYLNFKDINKIERSWVYIGNPIMCYITIDKEATEEEALKIATDRIAQWKYAKEMGELQ